MVDENIDLETALAPDDEIFDIDEDLGDPLAESEIQTISPAEQLIEEPFEDPLEDPLEDSLEESVFEVDDPYASEDLLEEDVFEVEEPVLDGIDGSTIMESDLESLPDAAADLTGDYIEPPRENLEELLEDDLFLRELDDEVEIVDSNMDEIDYLDPETLVASIIDKARAFTKYSSTSQNSLRRAIAVCDHLERMIVDGVIGDATTQKLSLAELKLLDDIEAGILTTKAELQRPRKVEAKSRSVDNSILYDPFCATVARILVNAQVQGGKKIQDIFSSLKDRYGIDQRESLMISQIMNDLGYPVRSLIDGQDMLEQYYA